jgi:hypothetical protein
MSGYLARVLMLCTYYAALNYGYWAFFKPGSAEEYFEVNWLPPATDPNAWVLAAVIAVCLSAIAAKARNNPPELFGVVLLLSPVMPMLVVYSDRQTYGAYVVFSAVLYAVVFAIINLPYRQQDNSRQRAGGFFGFHNLSPFILAITLLFICLDIAAGNLANVNFDFSRVYDFRRLAQETRGVLLGYYESNLTAFLLGLGTVVALHRRQWVQISLYVLASLVLFALTSNRGHFFIVFVSIVFYWVALRKNPFAWIVLGAALTAFLSGLFYQLSPSLRMVGDNTIGRVMFVPAVVNFMFYEFFSENPFTYWSDTRISFGLIENPYSITGPRVVFDHFYGKDLSEDLFFGNANTGFLGAGYGHAGWAGMAVYAVIVGLMVRLSHSLAQRTTPAISFGSLSYMFVLSLFTSADVPTILITFGYLLALILVLVLKNNPAQGNRRE